MLGIFRLVNGYFAYLQQPKNERWEKIKGNGWEYSTHSKETKTAKYMKQSNQHQISNHIKNVNIYLAPNK